MNKPFNNKIENKKYENLINNSIRKEIDKMILSTNINIMKYLEIIVSSLLLEINKRFPEPNYSIYITYRIKSAKSNIKKLSDYIKRAKNTDSTNISIKDFTDIIGLRIIVEKIPHNITIDKSNPEYKVLKKLSDERKKYIKASEQYHEFESQINDNGCTYFEYYTESKNMLNNMLKMFDSETEYSKDYAADLKEKYNKLVSECEKKLKILAALGDYSSKIDVECLNEDKNPSKIDFHELLMDFDSRIDSKIGLKLYSNSLSSIISNSTILQNLGISLSNDPRRIKNKREKSGYVSDFFGLDSKFMPIKMELQIMYANEHQESIIGYSAHSKMPGKAADFMQVPTAYVDSNMSLLNSIGNSNIISNDELSLLNKICSIKNISSDNIELFKNIISPSNVVYKDNSPIGIKIDTKYLDDLKNICKLDDSEIIKLKDLLYKEGCKIYNAWAKNISPFYATAKLDTDSSAKNRVKIHYDDAYECLAHAIREQVENHTQNSIDAEYYLDRIYKNQSDWLKNTGLMASESSIMDFEINEYTKNLINNLSKENTQPTNSSENFLEK